MSRSTSWPRTCSASAAAADLTGCCYEAPARRFALAGAFVLATSLAACGDGAGGGGDEGPRVLELTNDTIQLEPGVHLIDVAVRRDASGDFAPASIEANVGDVVRFTAHDRGGHALVFDGASLTETVQVWLSGTGQLRSPPLISDSSAWVISLKDAPAGEYPFRCTTHAASGRLTVRAKKP